MKNFICLLAIVILGFTACEGPEGPPGPVNIKTITYTVRDVDWKLVGGPDQIGSYYQYIFDEPFLTSYVYDYGTFIGYMFDNIDGSEVQTGLPYTIYDIEETSGGERPFSVQYMCDATPGTIAFKVVFSDFYTEQYAPPTCNFRLMYIW